MIRALKISTLLEACRPYFSVSNLPCVQWDHAQGVYQALCYASVTSSPQKLFLPLGLYRHVRGADISLGWAFGGFMFWFGFVCCFFFSVCRIATFSSFDTVVLIHMFYCSMHIQRVAMESKGPHTIRELWWGKKAVSDFCCF